MSRTALLDCLPWLGVLLAAVVAAYCLVRLSGYRARWSRLRRLHRNQVGAVQSLSFVLTLPLFIMVVLLILQVSQLMIGTIVVHYSASAAARAAAVWIPADLSAYDAREGANCISRYARDGEAEQTVPQIDPLAADYGPSAGGMTFLVQPEPMSLDAGEPLSFKCRMIWTAAVLACMPISPSRAVATSSGAGGALPLDALRRAYAALDPASTGNSQINERLRNKLDYAAANTRVELRVYHPNIEPPLYDPHVYTGVGPYLLAPDLLEFRDNEFGWQDTLTVTVEHDYALLPGPGRLLARHLVGSANETADRIETRSDAYVVRLSASATIGNEGDKPVVSYVQP